MSKPKTTHEYVQRLKERLADAIGLYTGAIEKGEDPSEHAHNVNAILAEPTPSDLSEKHPDDLAEEKAIADAAKKEAAEKKAEDDRQAAAKKAADEANG